MTGAPEANKGLDSPERVGIQRDQGRKGAAGHAPGKEEQLCCDPSVMNDMQALRTITMVADADERGGRLGSQKIRRRHEGQHCRIGKR